MRIRDKNICFICFSDCDERVLDGITANNHLLFCHSEAVRYVNFLSALVDDRDTRQGVVTRNDLVALWDEYAGPQKLAGMLCFTH